MLWVQNLQQGRARSVAEERYKRPDATSCILSSLPLSQVTLTTPQKNTAAAIPEQPSSPPNSVFSLQQLLLSDTSKKGVKKQGTGQL